MYALRSYSALLIMRYATRWKEVRATAFNTSNETKKVVLFVVNATHCCHPAISRKNFFTRMMSQKSDKLLTLKVVTLVIWLIKLNQS